MSSFCALFSVFESNSLQCHSFKRLLSVQDVPAQSTSIFSEFRGPRGEISYPSWETKIKTVLRCAARELQPLQSLSQARQHLPFLNFPPFCIFRLFADKKPRGELLDLTRQIGQGRQGWSEDRKRVERQDDERSAKDGRNATGNPTSFRTHRKQKYGPYRG